MDIFKMTERARRAHEQYTILRMIEEEIAKGNDPYTNSQTFTYPPFPVDARYTSSSTTVTVDKKAD